MFVTRRTPARSVAELLPNTLTGLIEKLAWPRSCRWACNRELFVRPVRWIVALLGTTVVPVEFAGVKADKYTWGHRVLAPGKHFVESADDLLDVVKAAANSLNLKITPLYAPFRWSEDFGRFAEICPCAMFGVGCGTHHLPLHNPDYVFNDDIIETCIDLFEKIIIFAQ